MTNKVVIIGGSGVSDSPIFKGTEWKTFETGFSNGYGDGMVEYQEEDGVVFIPRHGHQRKFGPSKTQYGANALAAYFLGDGLGTPVVSTSAVGSLKKHIGVENLVVPNGFVDESRRDDNFFGDGFVVHLKPSFSTELYCVLIGCANKVKESFSKIHGGGTYVTIPGDRFGDLAEGQKRSQYADIVGMTLCPETALLQQIGLRNACAAFVVDSDSDANHEGQTLEVMARLSEKDRVPKYISLVVEKIRETYFNQELLPQLKGNIIAHDTQYIKNDFLKQIAQDLTALYCR